MRDQGTKKAGSGKLPAYKSVKESLDFGLGLAETGDAIASFPLTALLEQVDALEALQDVAFDDETAAGGLETGMLGHKSGLVNVVSGLGRVRM